MNLREHNLKTPRTEEVLNWACQGWPKAIAKRLALDAPNLKHTLAWG